MTVALAFAAGCAVSFWVWRAALSRPMAVKLLEGLGDEALFKLRASVDAELAKRRVP